MTARSCGGCSACCTALGVTDLPVPKPRGVRCDHIVPGGGCSTYASKPSSCCAYTCGWLHGVGAEDDRPDRLGIIVETQPALDGGASVIVLRECSPGAINASRGAGLARTFADRTVVLLVRMAGGIGVMGPQHRVQVYQQAAIALGYGPGTVRK